MSALEELVLVDDAAGVRTLTLNRPERRNALSPGLVTALKERVQQAGQDDSAHVIVVRGAGRDFCAGGDLGPTDGGTLGLHEGRRSFAEMLSVFRTVGKPSVACVQGRALGGGFGLMLACDLVVCAEDAQMGTPEIKLGLFPMMIMPLLHAHLGRKRTIELILTGGRLDAPRALDWGCVNRVAALAELDESLAELVGSLRAFSPAVHRLGLHHFHQMVDLSLEQGEAHGAAGLGLNMLLDDAAEGVSAFFAKRAPEWTGR